MLSGQTVLGRAVRLPLKLIPDSATLRVLSGPNRGRRWVAGSGTHGCWIGSYEVDKARLFADLLGPGDVVYDVGAQAGYYTLLSAARVGPDGLVVAFEPLPANVAAIRKHVALNGTTNVRIIDAAVAARAGTAHFEVGETAFIGRVADAGALEVASIALDDLEAQGIPAPTVMKMDIEGGEIAAFEGAAKLLETARPVIFLATHGPEPDAYCRQRLLQLGYRLRDLDAPSEILAEPEEKARV